MDDDIEKQEPLSDFWRTRRSDNLPEELANVLAGARGYVGFFGSDFRVDWGEKDVADINEKRIELDFSPLYDKAPPYDGSDIDLVMGTAIHETGHAKWSYPKEKVSEFYARKKGYSTGKYSNYAHYFTNNERAEVSELNTIANIVEDFYVENKISETYPTLGAYLREARKLSADMELPHNLLYDLSTDDPSRDSLLAMWGAIALIDLTIPECASVKTKRTLNKLINYTVSTAKAKPNKRMQISYDILQELRNFTTSEEKEQERKRKQIYEQIEQRQKEEQSEENGKSEDKPEGSGKPEDKSQDNEKESEDGEKEDEEVSTGSKDKEEKESESEESETEEETGEGSKEDNENETDSDEARGKPEIEDEEDEPEDPCDILEEPHDEEEDKESEEETDESSEDSTDEGGEDTSSSEIEEDLDEPYQNHEQLRKCYSIDLNDKKSMPEYLKDAVDFYLDRKPEDITQQVAHMLGSPGGPEIVMELAGSDNKKAQELFRDTRRIAQQVSQLFLQDKKLRTRYRRGLLEGYVDPRRLHKAGVSDYKLFQTREILSTPSLAVGVLVDASGSMGWGGKANSMNEAMKTAMALKTALTMIEGVDLMVVAYNTEDPSARISMGSYISRRPSIRHTTLYRIYDRKSGEFRPGVDPAGGTPSGYALSGMVSQLSKYLKGKDKLIIHVTDGAPDRYEDVAKAVDYCKEHKIDVMTLTLSRFNDEVVEAYRGLVELLEEMTKLPDAIASLLKTRLQKRVMRIK